MERSLEVFEEEIDHFLILGGGRYRELAKRRGSDLGHANSENIEGQVRLEEPCEYSCSNFLTLSIKGEKLVY